jgi:hypothetical protein
LDVEKKTRAKDIRGKKIVEGSSSAHEVYKNPQNSHKKNSNKNSNKRPLLLLIRRRARRKAIATPAANLGIMLRIVRNKWRPKKKSTNMIEADEGTLRYGNLLPTIISVCRSLDWWVDTGANIHLC